KVASLVTLSLITGTVGRPGCGPFSLTGQPNAMGGREAGGLANLLPAHRSLASAADRAWVEDFWRVPRGTIAAQPGLTAVELVAALRSGRCKAVWIIATNPVASLPAGLGVDQALRAAELVIVQDAFRNDTLPFADVVLPAATWPEKTGAMTTSERRIHLVEALRPPPGEARPDWAIIRDVAAACGFGAGFAFPDEAAVFAEHAASTRGSDCDIAGVSHALLRARRSVQWPCPAPAHPGTARLFADGVFPTPDGRCRLWAGEPQAREEALDRDFPLVLTTGRIRDQWHTQTRSGLVSKLTRAEPRAFLELHPGDAGARGIADGSLVAVSSRRGACRVRARVTDAIRAGTVFLPMHWGPLLGGAEGRINAVTSDRCDPVSREPDLKYAAVEVRRWHPPSRRIVVVGAGAAALAFCQAHAAACPDDRLTVLGAEPEAFYDRVQLPHLVAGTRRWDELRRPLPEHVTVRGGCTVRGIDREQRLVRLDDDTALAYDHLVLATGSRPAMALPGPLPASGVLGLRRRADAEAIIAAAGPGAAVVVVGAGLLGLELADALRQRGAQVTVLQRSERVMGRQLDATAAAHLAALLRARGLDLRLQSVVRRVLGGDAVSAVELADGSVLPCTLLVAATGTEAEDGLARAAGLPCDRGVLVDDRLTTGDPAISAIGECAAVRDARTPGRPDARTWRVGTTPGAAAQAQALSAHLAGDPAARWRPQPLPNLLKVDGLRLAAVGEVEELPGDEVVALHDPARRRYLKAVVRDDRVVGALCLGDLGPWPRLLDLCQSGCELDELRDGLLAPGGGGAAPAGRLVCSCLQVGEDTIAAAARVHGGDPARVGAATRAGTGCGSCRIEVARICARAALAERRSTT
ncbi:MAG: FAD-dependent oxidoreductase, partial [Planctomycetes bacterium]|nr:FAD-dependent oxidoreductase [Planctomycetota bacterium]